MTSDSLLGQFSVGTPAAVSKATPDFQSDPVTVLFLASRREKLAFWQLLQSQTEILLQTSTSDYLTLSFCRKQVFHLFLYARTHFYLRPKLPLQYPLRWSGLCTTLSFYVPELGSNLPNKSSCDLFTFVLSLSCSVFFFNCVHLFEI